MFGLLNQLYFNKRKNNSQNVRFGLLSRIGSGSFFEGNNRIGKFSFFSGKMGVCSYIGDNVTFMEGVIGKYTSIGSNVHIINGRHPMKAPFVSTSPVFYANRTPINFSFVKKQLFEEYSYVDKEESIQVFIGNDCWIGDGASIVGGIKVEDGSIVLAGAVVTKDVPPYAIVGGVPAKIIGYRYDDITIESLLAIKWWNKDFLWLEEKAPLFSNIDALFKEIVNTDKGLL